MTTPPSSKLPCLQGSNFENRDFKGTNNPPSLLHLLPSSPISPGLGLWLAVWFPFAIMRLSSIFSSHASSWPHLLPGAQSVWSGIRLADYFSIVISGTLDGSVTLLVVAQVGYFADHLHDFEWFKVARRKLKIVPHRDTSLLVRLQF